MLPTHLEVPQHALYEQVGVLYAYLAVVYAAAAEGRAVRSMTSDTAHCCWQPLCAARTISGRPAYSAQSHSIWLRTCMRLFAWAAVCSSADRRRRPPPSTVREEQGSACKATEDTHRMSCLTCCSASKLAGAAMMCCLLQASWDEASQCCCTRTKISLGQQPFMSCWSSTCLRITSVSPG